MANHQSPIKLVTRTRNKWRQAGKRRSVTDQASAVGYIIWQLALNGAKKLHKEAFRYDGDDQRIRVIEEYLAFLVHVADRLSYDRVGEQDRAQFVSAVAHAAARHLQRNAEEIVDGEGRGGAFLALLNRRSSEYAECTYADGPGYPMRRTVGAHVQDVMGSDQTNKWVIDQVMDIDAPAMCAQLAGSIDSLLGSG